MSRFNPNMLVPAALLNNSNARLTKDVALDNINKAKHLFLNPDEEGKRNFTIEGEKVHFSVRINNTALVLGQYEQQGVTADVKLMSVPKAHFVDALDFYAEKIKAGEFDPQLEKLNAARTQRTDKMRSTRAAAKAEKAKVTGEAKKARLTLSN